MEDNKNLVNEAAQEDEQVQEPAQEETAKKTGRRAAKEKTVRIYLPITREEKAPVPVWVNDRSWLIQRGQEVEVPECVAEVLRHKEQMQEVCIRYDEQHAQRI